MVYATIIPGDYYLSHVRLFLSEEMEYRMSLKGQYTVEKKNYFCIPLDKHFTVPEKSALYMGEICIEIVNDPVKPFKIDIIQTEDTFKSNLQAFQKHFPQLYGQYQTNTHMALLTYFFWEDFNYPSFRSWEPRIGFFKTSSVCKCNYFNLDNKNDDYCVWSSTSFFPPPPARYRVHLMTGWLEGVENKGYGLMLGKNTSNFYGFWVSADGSAMVSSLLDNKWQSRPVNWQKNVTRKGECQVFNHLTVEVSGTTLTFFVNDNQIGRIENNLFTSENLIIGLMVDGRQMVCFKELKIEEQ